MEHLTTIVKKHVGLTVTAAIKKQVYVTSGVNRDGGGNTVIWVFFVSCFICLLFNDN